MPCKNDPVGPLEAWIRTPNEVHGTEYGYSVPLPSTSGHGLFVDICVFRAQGSGLRAQGSRLLGFSTVHALLISVVMLLHWFPRRADGMGEVRVRVRVSLRVCGI